MGKELDHIKKAEHHQRCFQTAMLEKMLEIAPWTARRSTLNIHWKDWC